MISRSEVSFRQIKQSELLHAELANAQEFVVKLRRDNFVPVRHLIAGAILSHDEQYSSAGLVYSAVEGDESPLLHADYDEADGSFFAHSIDHLTDKKTLNNGVPKLKNDPFIDSFLAHRRSPLIVGYDTTVLTSQHNDRWTPHDGQSPSLAIRSVYHLGARNR